MDSMTSGCQRFLLQTQHLSCCSVNWPQVPSKLLGSCGSFSCHQSLFLLEPQPVNWPQVFKGSTGDCPLCYRQPGYSVCPKALISWVSFLSLYIKDMHETLLVEELLCSGTLSRMELIFFVELELFSRRENNCVCLIYSLELELIVITVIVRSWLWECAFLASFDLFFFAKHLNIDATSLVLFIPHHHLSSLIL
jgi:hypothetical protein